MRKLFSYLFSLSHYLTFSLSHFIIACPALRGVSLSHFLVFFFSLLTSYVSLLLPSYSQLVVNNSAPYNDPAYMVQNVLLNPGVTVTNVTFNGVPGVPTGANAQMIGYFNGSASNIGIGSGVILMTGPLTESIGPNDNSQEGIDNGTPGDADLTSAAGNQTFNAAVLEFDFTSASDKVALRYVFASEEYDEYVCSSYNDVFAFYISGPGIGGLQNIALIPGGGSTAVAINSVNNGTIGLYGTSTYCISLSNSQYFVDNGDGNTPLANPTVEFDGFTTPLMAYSPTIIPCETYHMKIAVADVGDGIFDSGVFLETASFGAAGLTVHIGDVNTSSGTVQEGCGPVDILFTRSGSTALPYTLHFIIAGSASNGNDYTYLVDSIIIPAGQSTVIVPLDIFTDFLFENTEVLSITVPANTSNNTCLDDYPSEAQLTITNTPPLVLNVTNDTIICPGGMVTLWATPINGVSPYTYSWTTGGMNSTVTVNPATTTTYSVTVTDKCNTDTVVEDIEVMVGGVIVSTDPQQMLSVEGCRTGAVIFTRAGPTANPYTIYYTIGGTATNGTDYALITDSIVIPAGQTSIALIIDPFSDLISDGGETVVITTIPDPNSFCVSNTPTVATVYIANVDTIGVQISNDTSICAGNMVELTAFGNGGIGLLQYIWDNDAGLTDTVSVVPLDTTAYTVVVTDTCGNANMKSVTVNVIPPASMLSVTNDIIIEGCKGAEIKLIRNDDTTQSIMLYFSITGTAANGLDYNLIDSAVFVPAGQESALLNIFPFFDGITELNEDIIISLVVDTNCVTFLTKDTVRVINVDPVVVTASTDTILCQRQDFTISAQVTGGYGPFTYIWTDSITNQQVSSASTAIVNPFTTDRYRVNALDSCGNSDDDDVRIFLTGIQITGDTVGTEGCGDLTFTITRADSIGSMIVQLRISGSAINGIDFPPVSNSILIPDGSFSVTSAISPQYDGTTEGYETITLALAGSGQYDICSDSVLFIRIKNVEPISVVASGDTTICSEWVPVTATGKGGEPPLKYSWNTGQSDTLFVVHPVETTWYMITVSDDCSTPPDSARVKIIYDCEYLIYIPNAFSPNWDGINDEFLPVVKGIRSYEMYVLDRWGDVMFKSNSIRKGWDGRVNEGKMAAQQDIYVYKIIATDLLDKEHTYIGRVALVK